MRLIFLLFLYFSVFEVFGQDRLTISGTIKDASNGETIVGANVYSVAGKSGGISNAYGFYSVTLPKGRHKLEISYLGYKKQVKEIELNESLVLNFELEEEGNQLDEVLVFGEREDASVKNVQMSVNKMEMKTVKKMPALLGEIDVVRSLQYLPGVSSIGEGSSGFNVRGGGIDQNLVLLDEAPIYNSSHLMGFFSIFNPDVVKDVKLIKGGVPANYGGRVSSILDVSMKEGNKKNFAFTGGIGSIFSRFALEGPIVKDKGSFVVAMRRSYIDVLAKPFLDKDIRDSKFHFQDFTVKGNYKLDDKNTVYLSGYFGKDIFGSGFGFDWGNATTTVRWNRVFSNKLFLNTTAFYSQYNYALDSDLEKKKTEDIFRWKSRISNFSLKPDFTWYLDSKNTLSFGGQSIYYGFKPGDAMVTSGGESRPISLETKKAVESAIYVSNEQKVNDWLSLNYGLRYSFFNYFGAGIAYEFNENAPTGDSKPLVNSFETNGSIKNYGNFEPRFAANLSLSNSTSLKVSYNRLAQYIHLLSNTAASSPLDVWMPSTNNIKPQISDQVALGLFKNFNQNKYETSVELYYKSLENQIDYVRNAELLLNELVEGDLLYGKGRAYGAEFFVKKNKGALNGWVSYTLSRTERKIDGLNNNDWFLSRIDRKHNLSVVSIYDISKKWSLGATFSYTSGTPATFPTSKYVWQGIVVPHNDLDERNTYRIPASHRLDFSVTKQNKHAFFKKGESEWVFSVYNVYNRRNPFSVYVRQNPDDASKTEAVQFSVFGSILPSITYNFKF